MTSRQHRTVVFAAIPFLAAGGVILDFFTPLGVADWVWYFIPLLLSVYVGGRFFPYVLAAVFSLLTLAGYYLSPPGIDFHVAFMSRLMGVCVQWLMAFLISQCKRGDEEVRKLSRMVEQSPASIVLTDRAGNIEYVNPKFVEVTGYSPGEVIGKNPRILKSGETPAEDYRRLWEIITGGGEWRGEFHNRRKNGELYWELASISPIYDSAGDIARFLAVKEDITERKQAEEELRAREERLCEVNELQGLLLSSNPIEKKARLVTDAVAQIVGADFARIWLIKPGDRCETGCIHAQVAEGPHACRFRDRCLHLLASSGRYTHTDGRDHARVPFGCYKIGKIAAGEESGFLTNEVTTDPRVHNHAWAKELGLVSFAGYRLSDTDGAPLGVLALFSKKAISFEQDKLLQGIAHVTSQMLLSARAEAALVRERSLLRTLIDNLPDCIYAKDTACRKTLANPADLKNLHCKTEAEAIGKTDFDLFPPDVAPKFYDDDLKVLQGEPVINREEYFLSEKGEKSWLLTSKLPLRDPNGKIVGLVGIGRDITERKQAEEALSDSEERFRLLAESSLAGIYLFQDNVFVYVNPALAVIFGYAVEEITGRLGPQDLTFFEDRPLVAENVRRRVVEGVPQIRYEFRGLRKDGGVINIECHGGRIEYRGRPAILGMMLDITERKRTEAALVRERSLLRTLIDNLPDCIYAKDTACRKTLANPADLKNLHCKTEAEAIGKTDFDLFPPDVAQKFYDDDLKVLQGEPVINREEYFLSEKGEKSWLLTSKLPLRDPNGKIVGLVGIGRDITERKQAEQTLGTEQRLFNSLITATPDHVYFKDREGRFIRVNEAFARKLGLSDLRAILGKTDFDIFRDQHAWQACEDEQRIIATGEPMINREEKEDWTDGRVTWVSTTKMPLRDGDGKIVGIMGISRDITERKQAEEQTREQAALLDKAQDAILVLDLDDRIVFWNKSAERIYGWSAAEAIGKNPVDLFLGGAISPRYAEKIKAVKERGEWSGELQEITKDGKTITVHGRCNVVYDEQGRPKSRLIINTDITESKKLEGQFLRAQRMESLGILAGGIAHDLNNVLTPLLVAVQLLKQMITDAGAQRLLESLEANVQRGAGLVKQVLGFGRGVEGQRIVVHPKHIAREIRHIVNETFPKSVAFELHSAPDLWTVTGDPTQLHQILLNLCVNARDAMPGGGKLSLHMENVVLDEAYCSANLEARPGPYVCLTVGDTGTGIPKEIQEKIFDPFFTTKEPGKGTGLGLSTTLAIVKSHGGFIHCYSEPGQGSTFKVYLPANTTCAAVEEAVAEESRLPRGHNELVLFVDDEKPIRELAQKVLERFGYRALLAADGAEALALYQPRRNEIDVVITDMMMPIMDGQATITVLKSINPEIKIIGSSGLASVGGRAKAKAAGIQHFIPKPYTAETMLLTLHDVLNGKN